MPYKVSAGRTLFASKNYQAKILDMFGSSIVAYWPQNEAGGTVSRDIGGRGFNGAYTGVTLRAQGVGDGETAASYDGTTSYNNVYSAGLASAFNGAEGTLLAWARVSGAGVWTDATARFLGQIGDGNQNRVFVIKTGTANQLTINYRAANVTQTVTVTASPTGFVSYALTWSKSGDAVKAYINGVQSGATQTGLAVWAGVLAATTNEIGASSLTPTAVWSGSIGPVLVLNRAASAGEIAAASTL